MTKKAEKPLVSRHIQLYKEDWEFIEAHFGRYAASPIGSGVVIRKMVHRYCNAIRAGMEEAAEDHGFKELGERIRRNSA